MSDARRGPASAFGSEEVPCGKRGPSFGAFSALRCWTWTLRAPFYAGLFSDFTPGSFPGHSATSHAFPLSHPSPLPCLFPQSQQQRSPRAPPSSLLSLFNPAPGYPSILTSASCTTHVYLIFYFNPAPQESAYEPLPRRTKSSERGNKRRSPARVGPRPPAPALPGLLCPDDPPS